VDRRIARAPGQLRRPAVVEPIVDGIAAERIHRIEAIGANHAIGRGRIELPPPASPRREDVGLGLVITVLHATHSTVYASR
jgi:hypothetical protein